MTIAVLTGIIIVLLFVLSDWIDDANLYKDKYKWYSGQYAKARHELVKLEGKLKESQQPSKQTITINVDTDEVVGKVMQGVNKKIEDTKKKEQIYIKVDGKEINANKLKEIIRKEGKGNENIF